MRRAAAAVSDWSIDKISDVCSQYCSQSLDDALTERFPDLDLKNFSVNEKQRIILVGCSIEASLERMIDWLSTGFDVSVNAIILNYVKTSSGDELITRTAMISEEVESKRAKSGKKFEMPMSDEPGTYDIETLKLKLQEYLSRDMYSAKRIRDVLLPACLNQDVISRDELKNAFVAFDETTDVSKTGYFISLISVQVGMAKNDFLRQVIGYEYPNYSWEKDNYRIRQEYRDLVDEVLGAVSSAV
jgi:hypothetical protein